MSIRDLLHTSLTAILAQRLRSFLTALGIAVGIAAVVLLTAIGEGVHRYVLYQFAGFGTNVISITPGRTTTAGTLGGTLANVRPLTVDDAEALTRIRGVRAILPQVQGSASVRHSNRSRRSTVLGVGPEAPALWQMKVALGQFLPEDHLAEPRSFAVLGHHLARQMFDDRNPLGALIRVGGERFRVIGVMQPKGQTLGIDLDDAVFVPVSRALQMFNQEGLMEISLFFEEGAPAARIASEVRETLILRHGTEDFTVTTQDVMLGKLGAVLGMITLTVAGLGGISLLVGAVGVLTIMTIAVAERTPEIGLLRAIGARRRQILALFLLEAMALSLLGGIAGLLLGLLGAWLLGSAITNLPVQVSPFYALLAVTLSLLIGLAAGVSPARSAARLDPVVALRDE